ncbi:MAG: hypothetical protein NTV23_14210 [Propionibacteriales bacterium]|nr:hypothetical protein [Propionibacteriales bacterium]
MPDPSPFISVARRATVSSTTKRHLMAISRSIEARALAAGPGARLWVCLQSVRFHGGRTLQLHHELAANGVRIDVYGVDVRQRLAPESPFGLHDVSARGPLALEWNVLLVTPEFGLGMTARQIGPELPHERTTDLDTRFDWAVSENRDDVQYAASALSGEDFVLADDVPAGHRYEAGLAPMI